MINLTPHAITVYARDGVNILGTILNGPTVARVESAPAIDFGTIDLAGTAVPIAGPPDPRRGEVVGLPRGAEAPDILVSHRVAQALAWSGQWPGRVFVPDSSEESAVRGPAGDLIGVRRLLLFQEGRE